MGFTVTPLAQKARTKTLIADSDLNLGNYDLIATDVRGDTAEFGEFVGGVGNFSNVLGSGNLDIEGTGNIKGLTTFQNAVQVNGSLHVEGSINNVNIADNGEITTAQGVNGADFNGAKITSTKFNGATIDTSGNVTGVKGTFSGAVNGADFNGAKITSTKFNGATIDTSGNVTGVKGTFSGAVTGATFNTVAIKKNSTYTVTPLSAFVPITGSTLLPLDANGNKYTGSIQIKTNVDTYITIAKDTTTSTEYLSANVAFTITFTNIRKLSVQSTGLNTNFVMSAYTLS